MTTFAWYPKNVTSINSTLITHKMSIEKLIKPVQQKKRKFASEKQHIKKEVNKLLSAGLIKKVQYSTWFTNVVLIKKGNEKWRMCLDFTNLNKACLLDHYPLPSIDKLVDSILGPVVVSFLDAILGYHQIFMDSKNTEKTAFITDKGVFCYKVMPFGLKNVGVIYQRLMSCIFKDLVGTTGEVYLDDMVVKSQILKDHSGDIQRVFDVLDKAGLKLNPKKGTFRVKADKFLGFMVSERGI